MKLGQMLSMDSGLALPPEFSAPLAQLQANAPAMPPAQLKQVLAQAWGADWLSRFQRFDVRPIAAASIGQVHRGVTRDGRDLAIKVQFPGIARSIDSDIATLGRLMRLPGVMPRDVDIAPFLEAARAQLHDEADYQREARALARFRTALGDGFIVPAVADDLTTPQVLAMDFIDSQPIDTLGEQPQAVRDTAMAQLVQLTLREVFELGQMQTDPNFANYRLAPDGRIVLLDFGATRDIAPEDAGNYRALLRAMLAKDRTAMSDLMQRIGYFRGDDLCKFPLIVHGVIGGIAIEGIKPIIKRRSGVLQPVSLYIIEFTGGHGGAYFFEFGGVHLPVAGHHGGAINMMCTRP
jgi:predicted unusual protein kinase regulating ubiquinone biosynthesis (AarF/ABC1/UbiB family)